MYQQAHPEKRRIWNRTRKTKFYPIFRDTVLKLKNKPCADCQGWFEPCQMQFDHKNPKEKKFEICKGGNYSRKAFLEEVSKCEVVCANCHALRTHKTTKYYV